MSDLKPGLYDQTITTALRARLDGSQAVEELGARLTPDTAPEILARHVFDLVRAALSSVPGRPRRNWRGRWSWPTPWLVELERLAGVADTRDQVLPERLLQLVPAGEVWLATPELVRPGIPLGTATSSSTAQRTSASAWRFAGSSPLLTGWTFWSHS